MDEFGKIADKFGVAFAMFVVFVLGLHREWWVMGNHHRHVKQEKDDWRAMYLQLEATLLGTVRKAKIKSREPLD